MKTLFARIVLYLLLACPMAQAAEPQRIVLALPGPNVAPFLPLELIPRIGADRRAGFRLSLRHFGGGPLAARDTLEKNSDFAGLGMPALAGIRLEHPDLVSIAALTQAPAYVLMVRRELPKKVRRAADLRGMNIGVHGGGKLGKSTARQMTEYLLLKDGVDPEQVNFVSAGQNIGDYSAALDSGAVEAIMVNEPAATLLEQRKLARRLADLHDPEAARRYLGGRFLYTQIAATRTLLREQPDKARRLTAALREALTWLQQHSGEEIVARLDLPEGEEKAALQRFLASHKDIYSRDGRFDGAAMKNSEAFFHAVNPGNPAAAALRYQDSVDDRWAGR